MAPLSLTGAVVATAFGAMSLTPSLVPREWMLNGILVGLCMVTGYGIGAAVGWSWRVLSLPVLPLGARRRAWQGLGVAAFVALVVLGWLGRRWQGEQLELMGMDPSVSWWWWPSAALGLVVAGAALSVGRGVTWVGRALHRQVTRLLPSRASWVVATALTTVLVWVAVATLLVAAVVLVAGRVFAANNAQDHPDVELPTSAHRSGGPQSAVAWEDIGREGRAFVARGPSASDIAAVMQNPDAVEPVRAYVGVRTPGSQADRAALAIAELRRLGGFERSAIAVAGTTGTGWIDAEAAAALEYVANGDVATVATQYSVFPSWLSFITDRQAAERNAELLITALRVELDAMAPADRPALYVYGESLGEFSTGSAFTSVEDMSTTTDGALLIGPPSFDETWQKVQAGRDVGSPLWQPRYGEGELVRVADGDDDITDQTLTWRTDNPIIYLAHSSDPVVAWTTDLGDWLAQRGPDIHPQAVAWPVVGRWQATVDQFGATAVPPGHGHVYDETVVTAWSEILGPPSLPDQQILAIRDAIRRLPR